MRGPHSLDDALPCHQDEQATRATTGEDDKDSDADGSGGGGGGEDDERVAGKRLIQCGCATRSVLDGGLCRPVLC